VQPDKLLLSLLLPLWLVCLGFHLKEIARTGFAEPPIYAARAAEPAGYPTVGGFRIERGRGGDGLRTGDRLIRVGATDLRGVGYLSFDAIALDEAGLSLETPLVFERAGQQRTAALKMLPSGLTFYRVVPVAAWVLVATLILLRGRGASNPRLLFAATMCVALLTTPFFGGPRWQTLLSLWVFHLVGGVAFILALRWALGFPEETREASRFSAHWCWLGSLFWVVRIGYFQPNLLAADLTPKLSFGLDVLFVLGMLAVVTHNYRNADPIGRRRVKWVVLSAYFGVAPLTLTPLALLIPGLADFSRLFEIGVLLWALVPIGLLIGILRYNLYDIDRLISSTVSYSALGVVLLSTALILLPRVASAASGMLGIDPAAGQTALSVLLAVTIIPAQRRIRPQIERLFFQERYAMEQGIDELLRGLSASESPQRLTELLGERLDAILHAEAASLYLLTSDGSFEPAMVRGNFSAPGFDATSLLVSTLRTRPGPLMADAILDGRRAVELSDFDRAALDALGLPLALPIRRGLELVGFLCLGSKRSGDVYTSTDVALLTAVSDRVSGELARFDQAEMVAASQTMQEEMRRYVPGAIAEQIEAGEGLEAGEREISVLFVDLRSYTHYAEGLVPDEIFSTINRYTDLVSRVVRAHGGSVVEFNGDGMMAVFGAPTVLAHKELAAIRAGRGLIAGVDRLFGGDSGGEPGLSVGIGIATGSAYVGNIKAVDRLIWTAIGNTTNLAARLQQLTRELDACLAVDDATWQAANEDASDWRLTRAMAIRGRSEPIDIHHVPLGS